MWTVGTRVTEPHPALGDLASLMRSDTKPKPTAKVNYQARIPYSDAEVAIMREATAEAKRAWHTRAWASRQSLSRLEGRKYKGVYGKVSELWDGA
jgi:hypothetical protein